MCTTIIYFDLTVIRGTSGTNDTRKEQAFKSLSNRQHEIEVVKTLESRQSVMLQEYPKCVKGQQCAHFACAQHTG